MRTASDIVIGAMTTQHEVIGSDLLAKKIPILRETASVIADPQVRYVGTIGGNVANGDPGNDMPAVMMCLNATYHAVGKSGERRIAAREFYQGAYFTALEPGEIVTAIRIPHAGGRTWLRLRKAQTQGRRLCDGRRRGCADGKRRQGGQLLDRPDQCGGDAAVGRGGKQDPDRLGARRCDSEESRGGRRSNHVAGELTAAGPPPIAPRWRA